MKLLHVLATGGRLVVGRLPHDLKVIDQKGNNYGWQFRPVTINCVIAADLVELVRFGDTSEFGWGYYEGEYKITEAGLNALTTFCKHKPEVYQDRKTVEIIAGQLICRKCGRSVPCASRKKSAHPANAWSVKYGPMCKWCWRQVFGTKAAKNSIT
jgi:hypothetical protein